MCTKCGATKASLSVPTVPIPHSRGRPSRHCSARQGRLPAPVAVLPATPGLSRAARLPLSRRLSTAAGTASWRVAGTAGFSWDVWRPGLTESQPCRWGNGGEPGDGDEAWGWGTRGALGRGPGDGEGWGPGPWDGDGDGEPGRGRGPAGRGWEPGDREAGAWGQGDGGGGGRGPWDGGGGLGMGTRAWGGGVG